MLSSLGSQIALLAFSVSIVAGIVAGNSTQTVLTRAMLVTAGALVLGRFVALTGRVVLRDHLQRRKQDVDREHVDAIEAQRSAEQELFGSQRKARRPSDSISEMSKAGLADEA